MKLSSLLSRFRNGGARAPRGAAADVEPPAVGVKTFEPAREEKGGNGNRMTMPESTRVTGSLETEDAGAFEVEASVQTDVGRVREINEDSGRFSRPSDPATLASKGVLLVVADGMGGHSAGEVASGMTIELVPRL